VLQDDSQRRITRRAAIQLGVGAGVLAASAPYVSSRSDDAGVDITDAELALAPNPSWPAPSIITRAQWGANESLRKAGQIYDSSIAKIIVHHTGTPNSITNYASLCRGILANETSGEYIDIAYNWLVDPQGKIYEGRWAQNYSSGSVHTGERLGANVRGGHAGYHNTRTIGVALMGNYDLIDPPGAMVDGLVSLLAWKCARWGLDPLGHSVYNASNGTSHDLPNICGHRDVNPTACPGGRFQPMLPSVRSRVAARVSGGGYWIASRSGQVVPFGGAVPSAQSFSAPYGVSGIAGLKNGSGYWLFAADGSVYSFAGARFFGSMHGKRLAAPIVGMAATPSGNGYWLVAQDGGIFSFGDAKFYGSTGSIRLARPVVSMAARPQGDGYWMIAEDGGVFSFGKAPFRGSGARQNTTSPCVSMLTTTTGNGYVMLRKDGSVSAYGDAPNLGNARGRLRTGAVGIAGRLKPL
jgi:hypothetical protein